MRFLFAASALFLVACGATQFTTHDPYADGGAGGGDEVDAGATGGGSGGGATGGSGGGATGGSGGGATGGGAGGGATGGGAGGGAAGGGGGATGGGGGAASCSAANCQGCCAAGVCQAGTTNAQCGRLGAACAVCPAATDICKADQTCGIDPASVWRALPTAAEVAADNNGFAWDDLSEPDAELGVWCPATDANVSAIMPKVNNDYFPTWSSGGCTATAAEFLADGLAFDAIEIDFTGYDLIAPFTVTPITEAHLRAGTKTIGPSAGLDSMTVRFTKL